MSQDIVEVEKQSEEFTSSPPPLKVTENAKPVSDLSHLQTEWRLGRQALTSLKGDFELVLRAISRPVVDVNHVLDASAAFQALYDWLEKNLGPYPDQLKTD